MAISTRSRVTATRAVLLIAIFVSETNCGGHSPSSPSSVDVLSERVDTSHFVFLYSSGDHVDTVWEEAFYAWVVEALGAHPPKKIEYRKYRDRQHMGRLTGNSNTNGYADAAAFAIHTIWPTDNHEVVHLYSLEWGSPVALFSEGFAVAHSTNPLGGDLRAKWNGTPVHDAARQLRDAGRLVAIADLATTASFRRFDPNATYPEAGSFVRFLIDSRGLDRMKAIFGQLTADDTQARVEQVVSAVYGVSLSDLEAEWLNDLR